jgi:KUP system potassium uptake protein
MSTTTTVPEPALAHHAHATGHGDQWKLALGALGVVYGDIGTSPLYAIRESLQQLHHGEKIVVFAPDAALGVLSLATWALILVVVIKYLTFALRADNHGEGGILALLALLTPRADSNAANVGDSRPQAGQKRRTIIILGLLASALLLADGMITPAISVLGAVEGLEEAGAPKWIVLPISVVILVGLFLIQRHGTASLGRWFGPLMIVWFGAIAVAGLPWVLREPQVLTALSPHVAFMFFVHDPLHAFLLLGAIVLVVTGAEALYADMGHFGRGPIRTAWYTVVFPSLLLNYYGQVACVIAEPANIDNPFWHMIPGGFLRYAMTGVAAIAAIIASQALISGAYSLAQQAVQLGYSPRLQIVHTSEKMMGQVYVPFVNNILMIACVTLVLIFRSSTNLASMYGLSVTGTMTITTIMLYKVARERWGWSNARTLPLISLFMVVDVAFFCSNLNKVHEGGWVALMVGGIVFAMMYDWFEGRNILAKPIYSITLPMSIFLEDIKREKPHRVSGVAVFMTSRAGVVPMVLMHHLKHNRVLHEKVILTVVQTLQVPKVPIEDRIQLKDVGQGFYDLTLSYGFMENPDIPEALRACSLRGLVVEPDLVSYYLGRVSLRVSQGGMFTRWFKTLFSFLYHNERPATEFFNLPANRVVELGRQLEL